MIESGIPTEALLAQIAVARYAEGLPLYHQEAIYARDKVELDRALIAQWTGRIGFELEPLAGHLLAHIKRSRANGSLPTTRSCLRWRRSRARPRESVFLGLCP